MSRQIQGSQTDFSFGEVDAALKRADGHPARKGGLRQMANARILNSGGVQQRSGRSALYPNSTGCTRIEEITMSAGNVFKIAFGPSRVEIRDAAGAVVTFVTATGSGGALPWTTAADIQKIVYVVMGLKIYITAAGMRPQVFGWDGISAWTFGNYGELSIVGQKRTPFYRISPQGITIQPSAQSGAIIITASQPVFAAGHVGTRIRFVNRQILITAFTNTTHVNGTVQETLPGAQSLNFLVDPAATFSLGDVVLGSTSGSKGIVTFINSGASSMAVQLLTTNVTSVINPPSFLTPFASGVTTLYAFTPGEIVAGPGGSLALTTGGGGIISPQPCAIWDEEVMNDFRGYPASCFTDQFRLGFCNFPSVPGGIGWSAINSPNDLYVGANPSDAMFEIAPAKVQVYHVVPGPESSEFVFCDRRIYYIPISPTNPLKPGSVQFAILSGDGSAQVQPRLAQEAILYCNAGQNSVMAVIATGAFLRPFNTKNLCDFHAHLFNSIQCIAAPSADGTFNERYAYVLNGDGSIAVGKYNADTLPSTQPTIGWGPWSGAGVVSWVAAHSADVIFTTSYFGTGVCEILDDTQYLDCALSVNSLPAAFTPPGGKGPLWFIPSQSVSLIDQVTRIMGTYQIDANGFIIPQFNGGEDLTIASLVAGQPWTSTVEPFAPDATSGADVGQRMKKRSIANFAVYVENATGFLIASLFSSKQTPTSPPLGTIMFQRRFPTWDQGEDQTKPPFLRETVEMWSPTGSSYTPRVAIIKDTPGPLMIAEIGMEISL